MRKHREKPKRAQIEANLELMASINGAGLKLLTETFDCIAVDTQTGEALNTPEIINLINNTMGKPSKKFTDEVAEQPSREFVKFAKEGDSFEGILTNELVTIKGKKDGEKDSVCCVVEDADGKQYLLPSAVKLNRKLENLKQIKADSIAVGIDIYIEFLGSVKVEGVTNKMHDFKVLTT